MKYHDCNEYVEGKEAEGTPAPLLSLDLCLQQDVNGTVMSDTFVMFHIGKYEACLVDWQVRWHPWRSLMPPPCEESFANDGFAVSVGSKSCIATRLHTLQQPRMALHATLNRLSATSMKLPESEEQEVLQCPMCHKMRSCDSAPWLLCQLRHASARVSVLREHQPRPVLKRPLEAPLQLE